MRPARPARRFSSAILAAALPLLVAPGVVAQSATRPLTLEDYGAWSRITQVEIAPDGGWMTYAYQPNEGDPSFFVRSLDRETAYEAVNGQSPDFSSDGRWVAFFTTPPDEETEELREERQPVPRTLHVIDLASGERDEHVGVRGFAFSDDARWLAVHRDRSDSEADHQGSDLILHDLADGDMLNLGNVTEFAFNEGSARMAYLVDAANGAGNGLYLVIPGDGRIRPLSARDGRWEDLAWNEAGTAVAALVGEVPDGAEHRANRLVLARGVTGTAPVVTEWDPTTDAAFPDGFVLSELANTRWTEDGARIVVGIKAQEEAVEDDDDDERPDVDVWHWMDADLQSRQEVTAPGDRRFTYTAVYNVADGSFVRLATDAMRRVDIVADGRWAIGRRDEPYRWDYDSQGGRADYVRLDPTTGAERVFAEAVRRPMGGSPDGRWFLYSRDGVVHAVDLESLETTNLTAATGIDFENLEFDAVAEPPAYGVGGWTDEGRVLLYTRFDIHAVSPADGSVVDVTGGAGARDQVRYRIEHVDDEDWIDLDGALLSAYGEWTKQSGYVRARAGRDPEPLLVGDEMIDDVEKAENADRVIFTRQTFERFPDYWVAGTDFRNPVKVTDANPQIAEFAWGRRVLVDYENDRGHRLQATLALPAGYREGERYPMIVYFYEKMSQRHHQFSLPVYDDRPHMSTYASNGYLVLMPDIVYDDGLPGISALDDITAATERVIELGYADPDRVGLQGHSWGGYQSSFIVTQTDLFAAVVTGAPLTNLMSMYNILYKSSGGGNGPILEWSQGRFGVTPWDDFELYRSQSPVHHADKITTPFLILHGTDDGAVDWNQGLEFFTAARRLGKEVILLSYPGEPHHLNREANQKDFQIRMRQYFDHHLKGLPAPEWMEKGVPFLEKGRRAAPRVVS